jgi:glutamate-1-semialdehyde 2,1-aminomutase
MNVAYPADGFLEKVQSLAARHGALLVFDETITGFRYSNGGAQEEFGVIPDLATFGKGIANGYPLSALVGKAEFMNIVEDIFFSGTFGGETLSLAAAKAVLNKLQVEPVVATFRQQGQKILDGAGRIIDTLDISRIVKLGGHPAWSFMLFADVEPYSTFDIKTLFLQEMFKRGIYSLGTHNLSYAHSDMDIDVLLASYEEVLALIRDAVDQTNLHDRLDCIPLVPLFKVR